ncbi:hypothetical protein KQ296_05215 [Synechococcus sp. CS-197]|nr:hypothetical protein [Synechococcus sp. CS-197]CAK22519.1 Hypothetical protein SynWH7803_0093 [Synechococcus sp. WH 7803]
MQIYQFGLLRSGSTLVYNILKEIFYKHIHKCHSLENMPSGKLVITYRNPVDIIASSILRLDDDLTDNTISKHLLICKNNGFNDITELKQESACFLQYEKFYFDHTYIYNELEAFFGITIDTKLRIYLKDKYSVKNIAHSVSKFSSFKEYDLETHFHGKHISKFMGAPGSGYELFNQEQINRIESEFGEIFQLLGYARNNANHFD